MERLFLRRGEVAASFAVSSWQSVMFSEFEAQMSSEARPFPCVFGVAGHRQDQLRYLFLDPYDIAVLGEQLAHYVAESRSYGSNTSLVVFTRPRPVQTLDAYYRKLWLTLDQLARFDKSPWPADIPEQVDHPMWEFSFASEPSGDPEVPKMRVISFVLVVVPSTKCVYHCHIQLSGLSEPKAFMPATAAA